MLSEQSEEWINELILEGWNFYLSYEKSIKGETSWWADFTRRNGSMWENYEMGEAQNPDSAIQEAYWNIRNGVKMFESGYRNIPKDMNYDKKNYTKCH